MGKEDIIQFLQNFILLDKQLRNAINVHWQYQAELHELQKKPSHENRFSIITFLICLLICLFLCSTAVLLILLIIELVQTLSDPHNAGGSLLPFGIRFSLCIGAVLSFILSLIYAIHEAKRIPLANKARDEEYEKNRAMVPEAAHQCRLAEAQEKRIERQLNALRAQNVVPEDYLYSYPAQKLLEYLQKGRADSLEEAITLYESESAQEKYR